MTLSPSFKSDLKAYSLYLFLAGIITLLAVLNGCKTMPIPTVITESRGQEPLSMQEPTPTGAIKDIPAGVDRDNVKSSESFTHANGSVGKIVTVVEYHWKFWSPKTTVYTNCFNCHGDNKAARTMNVKSETPKFPWWRWPAYILGALVVIMFLYFMRPIIDFFKELMTLAGRFRK